VAAKLGLNDPGMDSGDPDALPFQPAIKLHREQDVGGFGAAVGPELGIGRVLEIGVFKVHVR
jgi:hypothetical protein